MQQTIDRGHSSLTSSRWPAKSRPALRRRFVWPAAFAAGAVATTSGVATACTCIELPSYVAVARADAVFQGRVKAIERPAATGKIRSSSDQITVRLEATTVWKGDVEAGTIPVTTAGTSASCGFAFVEGASYVVCARREGDVLETSLCSGTVAIENGGTLRRTLSRLSAQGGADMNEEAMALPIIDALQHGGEDERRDAAQSLAHLDIDPRPLMSTLTELAGGDDPAARAAAVEAIAAAELRVAGSGRLSPVPPLVDTSFYVRALSDLHLETRIAAARALARPHHAQQAAHSEIAVDALIDAASQGDRELRALAVATVAEMDPPPSRTEPMLRDALEATGSELRRAGARGLARMGARGVSILQGEVLANVSDRDLAMAVVSVLARDAHERDESFAALGALALVGNPASRADALGRLASTRPTSTSARALVGAALVDSSEVLRAGATFALRDLDTDDAWVLTHLTEMLDDRVGIVRLAAVRALASLGSRAEPAVPALVARLAEAGEREAQQVRAAIQRIAPGADASDASAGR